MGILAQWDSKVLGLNSANRLDWAGQWDLTLFREVIVTCPKLALGWLIQVQVMDSVSYKILKIYIYIKSSNLCHHQLAK